MKNGKTLRTFEIGWNLSRRKFNISPINQSSKCINSKNAQKSKLELSITLIRLKLDKLFKKIIIINKWPIRKYWLKCRKYVIIDE